MKGRSKPFCRRAVKQSSSSLVEPLDEIRENRFKTFEHEFESVNLASSLPIENDIDFHFHRPTIFQVARHLLLRERAPRPMLVCHCNGISDRTVRRMVRNGASTASQVGEACGAGTCCGGCVQTIDEIIDAESSSAEHDVIQPVSLPLARSHA